MLVCCLNLGASVGFVSENQGVDRFLRVPDRFGKETTPEMRKIAKSLRVTLDGKRNRQEPNRPLAPVDRGRPRGPETPKRLNTSQSGGVCSRAFA